MDEVTVRSTARIHSALLNESGYHGRVDGSIGFSIDSPFWEISVSKGAVPCSQNAIEEEFLNAVESLQLKLQDTYQLPDFSYCISAGIESHIGLGSKTALLMGFVKAVSNLFSINLSPYDMATIAGRGGTSGIGFWASQHGGFLWDAGRALPSEKSSFGPSSTSICAPPKLIASIDLQGYCICHFRFSDKGLSGRKEELLFKLSCPVPHEETKELLALVSGALVPSFLDGADSKAQKALTETQKLGFKAVEWHQQDKKTTDFKDYWDSRDDGIALCLSSMGPTMYCLTKSPEVVKRIIDEYHAKPVHFQVSKVSNGRKK